MQFLPQVFAHLDENNCQEVCYFKSYGCDIRCACSQNLFEAKL